MIAKPSAQSRYIGIRQAKRTIENIERRKRKGLERPNDPQLLVETKKALAKWELAR